MAKGNEDVSPSTNNAIRIVGCLSVAVVTLYPCRSATNAAADGELVHHGTASIIAQCVSSSS
eukprot:scaffold530_cov193-Alexandrium_tamarense.AAC.36